MISSFKAVRSVVLLLLAGMLLTCDAGERPAEKGSQVFSEISIHLPPESRWSRLGAPGTFMTTPRWLPDGSGLIASGYLGVGLYHLAPGGGMHVIDPAFRGRVTFESGGRTLCLRPNDGSGVLALDAVGREAGGAGCAPPPADPVRVLHEAGGVRIAHDELYGTLTWADDGGETVIEEAAWSAAAAPEGPFVAFCTGHLADAVLFVYGGQGEPERIEVGRGAHPAWLPGGRFLVFARPGSDGSGRVVRSELHLFDTKTRLTVPLTHTPHMVEMQPAVSPDGKSVAFSDWKSGAVMVAPLEEGAP